MVELLRDNLTILLIAVLVGAIVGYLIFRPRQRVPLSDSAPTRPHMTFAKNSMDSPREGNGIAAEAAAAASDVTGQLIDAKVHAHLGDDVADDFQRLKGVGPKFAQMLQARGFFRFDQLASLTTEEIARLDPHLGPFKGRIVRDRIVEQSQFLARGDQDGFETKFGKL
jgi:predicted flap endonuclease-1-like 5' DNA nuclease